MNIIFSLCGKGQRFRDVGFDLPKYLIAYNGAPMINHSVETLGLKGRIHFIIKKDDLVQYKHLEKLLLTIGDEIITIDHETEGAAQSILLAKPFIKDLNLPLVSANGDQFMNWNPNIFQRTLNSNPDTSYIVTFNSDSPGCSYVRTDGNNNVTEVREKKIISKDATVGIYHWAKSSFFFDDAEKMISEGVKDNNEYYVAPVYNFTIQKNPVKIYKLGDKEFYPIGTPVEYHNFVGKTPFFI